MTPTATQEKALPQDDHRGGGRMKPLTESDRRYISEQIDKFNDLTKLSRRRFTVACEKARKGCLWRIASRANLFDVPLVSRQLTDTQWNQVIDFIEQFQGGQQG